MMDETGRRRKSLSGNLFFLRRQCERKERGDKDMSGNSNDGAGGSRRGD